MKIDFSRVTDQNYKDILQKCQVAIGKQSKIYNLPILHIAAMNVELFGEVYENMMKMRHSLNSKLWKKMSEEELQKKVEEIQSITWTNTRLEIVAFFRDEKTGRVYVDYLEHNL